MTIGTYTDYTPPGTALPLRVPIGASSSHGPENFQEFSKSVADAIALTHLNPQTGTTYTFVLADATRLVTASNASAQTYTVPPQSSVAWMDGRAITVTNLGAGTVTIAAGAGVTVLNTAAILGQYDTATIIRTSSNTWVVTKGGGLPKAVVSGTTGTLTTDTSSRPGKTIYNWTGSGTVTVLVGGLVDVLILGGAGGGSRNGDGGGGAGGFYEATVYLPAGTHTVTIGAGGAAQTTSGAWGNDGGSSVLGPYVVPGGGGGGGNLGNVSGEIKAGHPGASAGGAGTNQSFSETVNNVGATCYGFAAGPMYGNLGGKGTSVTSTSHGSGGGGGAGGAGSNGTSTTGGAGGPGRASSITGSSVTYCGGGGGGGNSGGGGAGGSGGGGAGANGAASGTAGTANSGGGGGGGSTGGGAGGSGRVIVVTG